MILKGPKALYQITHTSEGRKLWLCHSTLRKGSAFPDGIYIN